MVTDDFSFPTITKPLPGFSSSLSLWRVSSSHGETGGEGKESSSTLRTDTRTRRKSMSYIESGTKRSSDDTTSEDEEDKMDMLWEDFNDDLHRVSSLNLKKKVESSSKVGGGMESDSDAAGEMVELCCVQALKMTKTSSAMLSPRGPSMFVIFKVLKKLFLLHNSHCSKKPIS